MRRVLTAAVLVICTASPAAAQGEAPGVREGAEHAVPLYGELLRVYDAPDDPFAPGHRGIDVAAPAGSAVHASDDGVVSFAGSVAGNLTVTVDHGEGLLTTYSFLSEAAVTRGAQVTRGRVVGRTGRGHSSGNQPPHIHLSARRNGTYFDPLELYIGTTYSDLLSLVS